MHGICRYNPLFHPWRGAFLFVFFAFFFPSSIQADINAKVAQLEIGKSSQADVVRIFGEPTEYRWGNRTFSKDQLPDGYLMSYPNRFMVLVSHGRVNEIRHQAPGYLFKGKIQVGSTLQEVLDVVGQPKEVRKGKPISHEDGVLFKDIDGRKGYDYYARADQGVRFFFSNDKVSALYLTETQRRAVRSARAGIARQPAPADFHRGKLDVLPTYDPDSDKMWQMDMRSYDLTALDLSDRGNDLLYADFDSRTRWPIDERMPANFDWKHILELGKNPGLGVRKLHERGITGKGVAIAIVDQPLLTEHQEYAKRLRRYEEINVGNMDSQMHGPAVASIAVGKTIGVAPNADLYYIASWLGDRGKRKQEFTPNYRYYAQAIRRILQINKQLTKSRKIRVISISAGWGGDPKKFGRQDILDACEEAKAKGMFIVSSSTDEVHGFKFQGLGRHPMADPNAYESYEPGLFWAKEFYSGYDPSGRLLVPMDSRTSASPTGADEYVFYRQGGWSWSIPYIAGVYALAVQVDATITPERFWSLAMKTGRTIKLKHDKKTISFGPIIDPVALIEALQKRSKK